MAQQATFYTITATGTQVTTGASTANVTIPNDASGNKASYVRLQAIANCYVKPGASGVTATANDILLSPNEALYLCVRDMAKIAYIQETSATKLNITPVEVG